MHDPKPLRRLSFFDKKVGILAGSPPIRDTQPLHGGKKIAGLTVDNPVNKRAVDSSASAVIAASIRIPCGTGLPNATGGKPAIPKFGANNAFAFGFQNGFEVGAGRVPDRKEICIERDLGNVRRQRYDDAFYNDLRKLRRLHGDALVERALAVAAVITPPVRASTLSTPSPRHRQHRHP